MTSNRKNRRRRKHSAQSSPIRSKPRMRAAKEPPSLRVAKNMFLQGEYDDALRQFDRAVRENPNHVQTLIDAARAYGSRFKMDKCIKLLRKAQRLASRHPDVQYLVGESFRMVGRYDQAQRCFETACMLSDDVPLAQLELATIHERKHKLDEAYELVRRVLTHQPKLSAAVLLKARLQRRQANHEQAERTLRDLTAADNVPPTLVAEAWGELAQMLDGLGQYDEAWQAILECKKIMLQRDTKEKRAAGIAQNRFRQFVQSLTGEQLDRWQRPTAALTPERVALLTSFPRSGTTLLEQVLDSHPQIVSSEEQDVFSSEIFPNLADVKSHAIPVADVLEQLQPRQIETQRSRYLHCMTALLGEDIGQRLHIDKNPAMTPMIPVFLRLFPEAKLVIALRDPRDVIVSCFLRYLPLNPVSVSYLTLDRLVERYRHDMFAWVKYRELLSANWIEVRYEEIVTDFQSQVRRIIDFLQLPWDEAVLRYRDKTRRKQVLSPTYEAVARPVYDSAVGRWKNYQRHIEPVLPDLEKIIESLNYPPVT